MHEQIMFFRQEMSASLHKLYHTGYFLVATSFDPIIDRTMPGMQARGRLCDSAGETRSLRWRMCRSIPTRTCSCYSGKFVNYRRKNGNRTRPCRFVKIYLSRVSLIERGILISFCDSFRLKSASLLSYADHMYDLCYVIFMSRGEITRIEIAREQSGKKIHSIPTDPRCKRENIKN